MFTVDCIHVTSRNCYFYIFILEFKLVFYKNYDDVISFAVINSYTSQANTYSKPQFLEGDSDVIKTNFELLLMQLFFEHLQLCMCKFCFDVMFLCLAVSV